MSAPEMTFAALAAALTLRGCSIQLTFEPADGFLALVDVFGDGGEVTTHEGISAESPARALAAAADGMALFAVKP